MFMGCATHPPPREQTPVRAESLRREIASLHPTEPLATPSVTPASAPPFPLLPDEPIFHPDMEMFRGSMDMTEAINIFGHPDHQGEQGGDFWMSWEHPAPQKMVLPSDGARRLTLYFRNGVMHKYYLVP